MVRRQTRTMHGTSRQRAIFFRSSLSDACRRTWFVLSFKAPLCRRLLTKSVWMLSYLFMTNLGFSFLQRARPFETLSHCFWVPDWLLASRNHVLFVDATMLGKYAFVMQYHGFAISYMDIAEQLAPFWEEELGHIYIFVPYFSLDPMQQDTRSPASNGLTVVLQRDAFAPACISDPVEAFRQYRIWGMGVEDVEQPPADLQWPVDKVQMTIDSETRLYSIGQLAPTPLVLSGLARRFAPGAGEMQVRVANVIPERHVWLGEPGSQMSAVSVTQTSPDMICVFLVMRGIGREIRAAWLKQRDFARMRILDALQLDIAYIPGFKISITGGIKERGRIVCRHGDVLFLNFVPEGSETESDFESDCEAAVLDSDQPASSADGADETSATSAANAGDASTGRLTWNRQRRHKLGAAEGTGSAALVGMWNQDVSDDDAMPDGDQGDTPASHCGQQFKKAKVMASPIPGRYRSTERTFCSAGMTTGVRLYVAGLALLQNVVSGGSVMLPLAVSAAGDASSQPEDFSFSMNVYETGVGCSDGTCFGHDFAGPPETHLQQWLGTGVAPGSAMPPWEERLSTLLEQAKDESSYSLCGELVWFFREEENSSACEKRGRGARKPEAVHIAPCVQCTCPLGVNEGRRLLRTEEIMGDYGEASVETRVSSPRSNPSVQCTVNFARLGRHSAEGVTGTPADKVSECCSDPPPEVLLNDVLGSDRAFHDEVRVAEASCYKACGGNADTERTRASHVISLEDMIRPGPDGCEPETCGVVGLDRVISDVTPWSVFSMPSAFGELSDLHPSTRQALNSIARWGHQEFRELILYVDGSFCQRSRKAGWSVVALAQCGDACCLMGAWADSLHGREANGYLGNLACNAFVAELAAMLHAGAVAGACAFEMGVLNVAVMYDSESAAAVSSCQAATQGERVLAEAAAGLQVFFKCLGVNYTHHHIKGHSQNPWNELADVLAKKACWMQLSWTPWDFGFATAVRSGRVAWYWLCVDPRVGMGGLPSVEALGHASRCTVQPRVLGCDGGMPGVPAAIGQRSRTVGVDAQWKVQLATYNVNSLKSAVVRQECDTLFHEAGLAIVGLQETRAFRGCKTATRHYHCYEAEDSNGHWGVQLWVHRSLGVVEVNREVLSLDASDVRVVHSSCRILALVLCCSGQCFVVVVGHAETETHEAGSKHSFWNELEGALKKSPKNAFLVLLLDANAHLVEQEGGVWMSDCYARGVNAERLLEVAERFSLEGSGLRDHEGRRLVSWRSPSGFQTVRDYILFPLACRHSAKVVGLPGVLEPFSLLDHSPIVVELTWTSFAKKVDGKVAWDVDKMRTDAGKEVVRMIHSHALQPQWGVHPDDHLHLLNEYYFRELQTLFPANARTAKTNHFSQETWQVVAARRQTRRHMKRARDIGNRIRLDLGFRAWCAVARRWTVACGGRQCCLVDLLATSERQIARVNLLCARLAAAIRKFSFLLRKSEQKDAASFVRRSIADGRAAGPSEFAAALRGILKCGRKYRPPNIASGLAGEGGLIFDKESVLLELGKHFAEAEHGSLISVADLLQKRDHEQRSEDVFMVGIPSVASFAIGLLDMQHGKAAGSSSFPVELYQGDPAGAALVHYPLVLKAVHRRILPALWNGTQVTGIPKQLNDLEHASSWRSIALAESVAKGFGKALRSQLAVSLKNFAERGQGGALRGSGITIPAQYVRSYLGYLNSKRKTGAVVFADGRAAYYSIVREWLHGRDSNVAVSDLQSLMDELQPDRQQQTELVAMLFGPGLLEQAGVHEGLRSFLQVMMSQTWFTMQACNKDVFATCAGSVPGTPLADMVYQFLQSGMLKRVKADLELLGMQLAVGRATEVASPAGWADDLAFFTPIVAPTELAGAISVIVRTFEHHGRNIGVHTNFKPGKTEVVCVVRGKGSDSVRRSLFSKQNPTISVELTSGACVDVRLVESYLHLGGFVAQNGSPLLDVKTRRNGVRHVLHRLQVTLLKNAELTLCEKRQLLVSLVVRKFAFGAGSWVLQTRAELLAFRSAVMSIYRQVLRPILKISGAYLNDHEVCCVLGLLSPEQILRVEMARQLAVVAAHGDGFLWDIVLAEGVWLEAASQALDDVLREHDADWGLAGACLGTLQVVECRSGEVRSLLKRYGQKCSKFALDDVGRVRRKAEAIDACRRGQGFVLDRTTFLGSWRFRCEICQGLFRTKAAKAAHLAKRHGVRSKVSAAFGTACQVCNVEYWQEHRLRQHLRGSMRCREAYFHSDIGGQGGQKDSGCLVGVWRVPSTVEGPNPWWATLDPVAVVGGSSEAAGEAPQCDVIPLIAALSIRDLGLIHFCERVLRAFRCRECLDISLPEVDREEFVIARGMLSFLQGQTVDFNLSGVHCCIYGSLLLLHVS